MGLFTLPENHDIGSSRVEEEQYKKRLHRTYIDRLERMSRGNM